MAFPKGKKVPKAKQTAHRVALALALGMKAPKKGGK